MSFSLKISRILGDIRSQICRILDPHQPALAYNLAPAATQTTLRQNQDTGSVLDGLMDSILWAAVPKTRRSRERRLIRRHGHHAVKKYMTPKRNIMACLECGHWHEVHTICGNCYTKVKAETEIMQNSMPEAERLYNIPRTEVAYVYTGEDRGDHAGKHVVEVEKERPQWFSTNLLTKGHRQ